MGTLRKLGQALGLVRRDKSVKAVTGNQNTVKEKKGIMAQIKEAIAEELAEPPKMKKWRSPYDVPGAFGKRPAVANCKKIWRNRHGKSLVA